MPRIKKEGTYINCKIDAGIAKELDSFCEQTGLSKTVTIERALKQYFDKQTDFPAFQKVSSGE